MTMWPLLLELFLVVRDNSGHPVKLLDTIATSTARCCPAPSCCPSPCPARSAAPAAGLPRLIYVKSPAPERELGLTELPARIQDEGGGSYRHFSAAAELRQLVADDLAVLLSERFAAVPDGPGRTAPGRRALPAAAAGWPSPRSSDGAGHPGGLEGALGPVASKALTPMGLMQWPFCVVIFDTELRIVWANEAAGRLGGTPAKGWPGRRIGEVLPQIDAG